MLSDTYLATIFMTGQRLAIQLQARRQGGPSILYECLYGGIVCNGLLNSA